MSTNRSSSSPYISTATRRRVGRPTTNDFVAKDVLILDAGKKKLPTKAEKVELEKNRRVISGFDIDRKWDASNLQLQLSNLLTGELTGISFEIVKNCSGTLVTPNIPVGKEIDAKLLLKSIAPAGCVYIRLLEELQSCSDPFNEQDEIPMDNTIFTPEIDGTDDSLISTVDLSQSTCAGPYFCLPILVHLLRPGVQPKVNVQKLLQILKPKFSEEGSNALIWEKETYQMFIRYVREVAASRRVCGQLTLSLSHILQFATCASEEPVLGFFSSPLPEVHLTKGNGSDRS